MRASILGRIVGATLLLASPVVWCLVELRRQGLGPFSLVDDVISDWFLIGLCGWAVVGLATARWWGRFLPLTIAGVVILSVLGSGAHSLTDPAGLLALLLSLVLLLCVSGRAMFEHFEARAPLPMSWTAPGMDIVRWALVAEAAGLIHTVVWMIYAGAFVKGSPLQQAHPVFDCFLPRQFLEFGDFLVPAVTAVVLMGGLVLLARQRTIGLFVTAAATLAGTVMIVISPRNGRLMQHFRELVALVPGLILAWAALIVWSRPVLRFLRGR